MFNLICLETEELYRDDDGILVEFTDGADAAREAVRLSQATSQKFQPRKVRDKNWRAREHRRLYYDGTYQQVPSDFPSFSGEHYVHMSRDRPGLIAYTESADKGELDRQTPIRPGAYLQKYWGDNLTQREIDRAIGLIEDLNPSLQPDLRFAHTADEMEEVYTNGPHSCMAHDPEDYDSPFHPIRVYAAGDLAVAYVRRSNGTVSARCLVWPAKKQHSTIYGSSRLLKPLLEAEGYREGDLIGARMRLVREDSRVVCPYIDSTHRAEVSSDGKHLVISNGPIEANDTDGFAYLKLICSECADSYEPDWDADLSASCVCSDCVTKREYFCDGLGEYVDNHDRENDPVDMGNGDTWSGEYFAEHGTFCYFTGQNLPLSQVTKYNGDYISTAYLKARFFLCSITGRYQNNYRRVRLYNGKLASSHEADYCDITDQYFAPIEVDQ